MSTNGAQSNRVRDLGRQFENGVINNAQGTHIQRETLVIDHALQQNPVRRGVIGFATPEELEARSQAEIQRLLQEEGEFGIDEDMELAIKLSQMLNGDSNQQPEPEELGVDAYDAEIYENLRLVAQAEAAEKRAQEKAREEAQRQQAAAEKLAAELEKQEMEAMMKQFQEEDDAAFARSLQI